MSKPAIGGQYQLTASLVPISTLVGMADPKMRLYGEITCPPTHAHAITIQLDDSSNPIVIAALTSYTSPAREFEAGSISVDAATPDATDVIIVDASAV